MKRIGALFLSVSLFYPALSLADNIPLPSVSTTLSPPLTKPSAFKVYGYLDASYNYLSRNNTFISGVQDRPNDDTLNGFTLQQGSLTLAYQPDWGLGALVNPVIGKDTYFNAPFGWNPYFGSQWVGFFIPQAFLQFVNGPLTVIGGSYYTLVGNETFNPTTDTNFSRGILWGYAEPTTHLGLRATLVVNDKLTVNAGINNGWDEIQDTGRRKTFELNATYTPNPIFSFEATGLSGGERATEGSNTGSQGIQNFIDLIATVNVTNKLTLIANYDYGINGQSLLPSGNVAEAVFTGIAGYANYKFNERWRTSLRGEVFNDRNGWRTGVQQCWKEITLTVGYAPIKSLELRAEARNDYSNIKSFFSTSRNGVSNNNQSLSLEGLYKFG